MNREAKKLESLKDRAQVSNSEANRVQRTGIAMMDFLAVAHQASQKNKIKGDYQS